MVRFTQEFKDAVAFWRTGKASLLHRIRAKGLAELTEDVCRTLRVPSGHRMLTIRALGTFIGFEGKVFETNEPDTWRKYTCNDLSKTGFTCAAVNSR